MNIMTTPTMQVILATVDIALNTSLLGIILPFRALHTFFEMFIHALI